MHGGSSLPWRVHRGYIYLPRRVHRSSSLPWRVHRGSSLPWRVHRAMALAPARRLQDTRRFPTNEQDRREAKAIVDAGVGFGAIIEALQQIRPPSRSISTSWRRQLASTELYSTANTSTAYGTVCGTTQLHGLVIYHVNPFALLLHATERSSRFAEMLSNIVASARHRKLNVVIYLDKAKPGGRNKRTSYDVRLNACTGPCSSSPPGSGPGRAAGYRSHTSQLSSKKGIALQTRCS